AKGGDAWLVKVTWADFKKLFFLQFFPQAEQEHLKREYHSILQTSTETITEQRSGDRHQPTSQQSSHRSHSHHNDRHGSDRRSGPQDYDVSSAMPCFFIHVIYAISLSLYPFTERYAQPYFFSCLIRQVPHDYDVSSATTCSFIHVIYVMYCPYIRSLSVMLSRISFHVLYGRGVDVFFRLSQGRYISSLRYIALPNWAHDALLESSSSKTHDASSNKVLEGSRNLNPTASSSNPPADQMETLTVESPIPTVSLPVRTACLNDSP
nr:zinc finger, CCHC-type, retrotransposon Gag domain protein [Tanacetum cinerariifolium]